MTSNTISISPSFIIHRASPSHPIITQLMNRTLSSLPMRFRLSIRLASLRSINPIFSSAPYGYFNDHVYATDASLH